MSTEFVFSEQTQETRTRAQASNNFQLYNNPSYSRILIGSRL